MAEPRKCGNPECLNRITGAGSHVAHVCKECRGTITRKLADLGYSTTPEAVGKQITRWMASNSKMEAYLASLGKREASKPSPAPTHHFFCLLCPACKKYHEEPAGSGVEWSCDDAAGPVAHEDQCPAFTCKIPTEVVHVFPAGVAPGTDAKIADEIIFPFVAAIKAATDYAIQQGKLPSRALDPDKIKNSIMQTIMAAVDAKIATIKDGLLSEIQHNLEKTVREAVNRDLHERLIISDKIREDQERAEKEQKRKELKREMVNDF